jgi:hypothetical protein
VVVDRVNRRSVAIVSDLLSAGSIAALPLVDALWGLDLGWFLALAVIGAFGDMPGMTARETLLPRLVEQDGTDGSRRASGTASGTWSLERLIGLRESLAGVLMIVGPALGGGLVALAGVGATALLVTAGTSTLAALVAILLPSRLGAIDASGADGVAAEVPSAATGSAGGAGGPIRGALRDLGTGWRFLLRTPIVLGTTLLMALLAGAIASHQMTIMPAYFLSEGRPGLSGAAMTGIALGGILGAVVFTVLTGRVRRRIWFALGLMGLAAGFVLAGFLPSPWTVIGAFVLVGLANGPLSAVLGVAAIEATPDGMRGRVLGAQNALVLAAPALLAAPMAAVATGYGLQVGGLALAAVIVVGTVVALFAPAFRGLDGLASSSTADADPGAEGADPGLGDAGPETGTTSESVPASAS